MAEAFICAYRAEQPARAEQVARAYADLARHDPGFRDAFLRDEIRIRTNFAFLGDNDPLKTI